MEKTKEKKFYTCRYDIAFKEVFMKEENKDILIPLLESILDIKIKELTYLNLEKNVGNIFVKRKHFDLHIKTENENIQLEVNNHLKDYTRSRNVSYICNTYAKEILKGEEYSEDIKIIQINLTYGLLEGNKYKDKEKVRIYSLQDNSSKKYVENFYIYEINMDYLMKLWYAKNEKEIDKYKYLIMLDLKDKELNDLSKKDKVVSRYMSEIEKINEDPSFWEFMSAEEDNRKIENSLKKQYMREGREEGMKQGKKEGMKQGIKKGIKEGIEQTHIETARRMKEEGLDIDIIKRITGIDVSNN